MYVLLFTILILALFFLSQHLTRILSQLFYYLFHSQTITIYLLSFLFLPGVIVHELSHLLMASLLFVPTGAVEFLPEVRGSEVKMGSVAIGQSDPFRRFLIGVAPVLGGLGIMLLASFYVPAFHAWWQSVVMLFIVFETTNTMFSSRKDMEGAIGFLLAIATLGVLLQLVGLPLLQLFRVWVQETRTNLFFQQLSLFLFVALGIDVVSIFTTHIILSLRKHH